MERWQAVKQIFHEALDVSPNERLVFLSAKCFDESVRQEVEKLLEFHQDSGDFLNGSAILNAELIGGIDEDETRTGEKIGNYKIIKEIGRGGMGAVYLAIRADDEFKQQAALKIIKRGMDTEFIVQRFRNERQILASLNHPNIARLYEGGTTADNLPYFVMEYVDGQDLITFCKERGLNLEARLNLFRQVCSAVSCAHQSLVVHRDLKPSNILVTTDGTPKLLDFGIAKLIDTDMGGETSAKTTGVMRLLTPEYASPEQIRNEPITTASDIYSLGVILYELLTGQKPYPTQNRSFDEIIKAVCETEPVRPSAVGSGQWSVVRSEQGAVSSKQWEEKRRLTATDHGQQTSDSGLEKNPKSKI